MAYKQAFVDDYPYLVYASETDATNESGGIEPSGTITITENGTGIDVAEYAFADVEVPTPQPVISAYQWMVYGTVIEPVEDGLIQPGGATFQKLYSSADEYENGNMPIIDVSDAYDVAGNSQLLVRGNMFCICESATIEEILQATVESIQAYRVGIDLETHKIDSLEALDMEIYESGVYGFTIPDSEPSADPIEFVLIYVETSGGGN